jgi:hypothetical protein
MDRRRNESRDIRTSGHMWLVGEGKPIVSASGVAVESMLSGDRKLKVS